MDPNKSNKQILKNRQVMKIMRSMKKYIAIIALFACAGTVAAQDYFDDIYYNPKKDKSPSQTVASNKKVSSYIENMEDMDVDTYNRRGQYYVTEIDTIGTGVENGEDFVYTQQIQKYYNPTIVVDNAAVLSDILSDAYGNVDIIINDAGYPVFSPWYYGWNWPYYSYWSPWSWSWNFGGWGWNIGWNYPWFSWNWGPGWWNPGPGPGPGWWHPWPGGRPGIGPGPMVTWNPRGNRSVGPRPGWSGSSQPGHAMASTRNPGYNGSGNRAPGVHRGEYGSNLRPGTNNGVTRPGVGSHGPGSMGNANGGALDQNRPSGVVNNNGRWQYNTSRSTGHRTAGTGAVSGSSNKTNRGTSSSSNKNTNSTGNYNRNTNSYNNYNSTTNRSYSPSRSTGSYGGGSHSSGGGRSTGGRSGGGGRR